MVFQQHMIQVRFLANKLFSSCEQISFSLVISSDLSPKLTLFSFRWSSSRLCNNNCWRRLVNRIFATWFLKNLNYLFFYSSYSGKIQNIDMVTHLQWQIILFSFFIFSIRSWNQDKDKLRIYFLLSITKRIGRFSILNMRSKYLPSFRWALHKQTDNDHGWLLTTVE